MEYFFGAVIGLVLGGLGPLAWRKRSNFASFAKALVAKLTTPAASGSSASGINSQPGRPGTSSTPVSLDDADKTMVVNRGAFGSIICCSGVLLGKQFKIPPQGLTIGRDPDSNDVVIDDVHVSAHHAQIRLKQGKIVVMDTGSENGIFLNDFQNPVVGEAALKPGDVIMLSPTEAAQFIYRQ
jgi:hypothetical protein